ncbi:hypothetical protein K8Q94_03205 [Candidatus Nomurabacteria bacterium]|nr:hypothetical protein [Candidatus Nomurabacteria bacterium]
MRKTLLLSITILLITVFSATEIHTAFAVTGSATKQVVAPIKSKVTPVKIVPPKVYTDDSISNLATGVFNKLIEQTISKDKLSALLRFSNNLTYDPDKQGLQSIYIPAATDGSSTYFSASSLSASDFRTDTGTVNSLTINTDLSVSGTAGFGTASMGQLTVGSTGQPSGITVYDHTTKLPMCIFSDSGTLQVSSGICE